MPFILFIPRVENTFILSFLKGKVIRFNDSNIYRYRIVKIVYYTGFKMNKKKEKRQNMIIIIKKHIRHQEWKKFREFICIHCYILLFWNVINYPLKIFALYLFQLILHALRVGYNEVVHISKPSMRCQLE